MSAALWIALKDLALLSRDRLALFWVIGFPLLFALFFGAVLTAALERERRPMSVLWVDEDGSPASRQLEELVRTAGRLAPRAALRADAEATVARGEATALVRIPAGFGERLAGGAPAPVEVGLDPSKPTEAALIRGAMLAEVTPLMERLGGVSSSPPILLEPRAVVRPGRGPRHALDLVFPAAVLWGLLGCAASFAVSQVAERVRGTHARLRVAPVAPWHLLLGKALACFLACLFTALLLTALGWLALDVVPERPLLLLTTVPAVALCFVGITTLLGAFGRTEQAVAGAGWATLIVMAMLGGAMVPLSAMPPWMARASDASPVKWGIVALEGALWRGYGWEDAAPALGVLLGIGLVCFALGAWIWSRRDV